ncbi:MAG: ABC transporter permease [Armatimonadetes bacterium]|nr:ABC transporter permease [Armatimonadota bacterium]
MAKTLGVADPIKAFFTFVGETALIGWDAGKRIWAHPREIGETVGQMSFIGVNSIPIVALTTFFSGSVLALYSTQLLVRYGTGSLAGAAIGLAVTREIAPVLSGIMVAARCGSAMAAQIGTMAVTEQIDALRALNVHPTNYLVIPRCIAGVTMLPILCLIGVYAGIAGGALVSVSGGIPYGAFMISLRQFVEPWDILGGLIKSLAFGLITALVACQQGLRTQGGAVGVGRSTTNTVVISMVLIYIANYFLAAILYTGR